VWSSPVVRGEPPRGAVARCHVAAVVGGNVLCFAGGPSFALTNGLAALDVREFAWREACLHPTASACRLGRRWLAQCLHLAEPPSPTQFKPGPASELPPRERQNPAFVAASGGRHGTAPGSAAQHLANPLSGTLAASPALLHRTPDFLCRLEYSLWPRTPLLFGPVRCSSLADGAERSSAICTRSNSAHWRWNPKRAHIMCHLSVLPEVRLPNLLGSFLHSAQCRRGGLSIAG
jgi:hypothetical protein